MPGDEKKNGWEVLALVLMTPFEAVWYGFALVKLWAWFAIPVFALRPLRIPEAIGLSLITHFLTSASNDAKEKRDTPEIIVLSLLRPLFVLSVGWIIHLFL